MKQQQKLEIKKMLENEIRNQLLAETNELKM